MNDTSMLVTISSPALKKSPHMAVMMLLFPPERRPDVIGGLELISVDGGSDADDVIEQVASKTDGYAELIPVHTVGCFMLEV